MDNAQGPRVELVVQPGLLSSAPEMPPPPPPSVLFEPESTPQHERLAVNELIAATDIPESGFYIRPVGSPPGTLDRMRRVVEKQKECYRDALVGRG
jgi:hypothetical protein